MPESGAGGNIKIINDCNGENGNMVPGCVGRPFAEPGNLFGFFWILSCIIVDR